MAAIVSIISLTGFAVFMFFAWRRWWRLSPEQRRREADDMRIY